MVLGVDISQEQGRAEEIRKKEIEVKKRQLAELQSFQSAAKSGGAEGLKAAMESAGWDTSQVEDWNEWITRINTNIGDLQTDLTVLGSTPVDVLGDMQKTADEQLQGTADSLKKWIDDAPKRASESGDAFSKAIEGGAGKASDALTEAQAELDALRQEAADAVDAKATKQVQGVGTTSVSATASSSKGTFNAVSLLGLQSASGPQEETAKNTGKAVTLLQKIVDQEEDTFA